MALSPDWNSPSVFSGGITAGHVHRACCERIMSTSRVCRTEREPATVATPPWRSIKRRAKARDLHEIPTLRSTRSFGWRSTPLASTGLWPPGWQMPLETVSSRADGQRVKITLGPKGRNVIIDKSYGARPRTASPSPRKLAQSPAARMFALRQLGASATPVSPKGNCDEQF